MQQIRAELVDALRSAAEAADVSILCDAHVPGWSRKATRCGVCVSRGRTAQQTPCVATQSCWFRAVRVTGALFHIQGGLVVDATARVMRPDGTAIPGLFAAGGATAGGSGPRAEGYLSGNGLLTAVALGWIAGRSAAQRS